MILFRNPAPGKLRMSGIIKGVSKTGRDGRELLTIRDKEVCIGGSLSTFLYRLLNSHEILKIPSLQFIMLKM
jgi:hypothetical protein